MSGLGKVGKALTVVFVVSMVALFAELLYVLWRRRVFRRQSLAVHVGDHHPELSGDTSKELLYFFCLKAHSRVEPDARSTSRSDGSPPEAPMEVIDVLKLQQMRGPSRVLFTIKEEEREDLESDMSLSSAEKGTTTRKTKSVCLEEHFRVDEELNPEVAVTVDADVEMTPFSTPCASPLYFTPSASPSRDAEGG